MKPGKTVQRASEDMRDCSDEFSCMEAISLAR